MPEHVFPYWIAAMVRSFLTAVRTLTILPLPGRDADRFEQSLPWFPVAGALLGALALLPIYGTSRMGPELASALSLCVLAIGTGCLHLDGVADTADGLGCHGDREFRLRIMKEPGVGAFAVVALVLLLLTKWAALRTLAGRGEGAVLVLACSFGRATIPALCVLQPYARANGTGAAVVKGACAWHAAVALLLALAIGWAAVGYYAVVALLVSLAAVAVLGWFGKRRIGGVTGDMLGATCEIAETAILATFCVFPIQ